ncbi:MAG: hypothetical protein ACI92S_004581, partial [Planctomycetaceae bacterium]
MCERDRMRIGDLPPVARPMSTSNPKDESHESRFPSV